MGEYVPPLTETERKVLREMIEDHVYRTNRGRYWRDLFSDVRVTLLAIATAGTLVVNVVAIFYK